MSSIDFTPSRLTLARERAGITQRRLSVLAGVSDRMIKAYEAGTSAPRQDVLTSIAKALAFPISFFSAQPIERLTIEAASFRALTKASASLRNRAVAAGTLALELHEFLDERFDLPAPDVPDLRDMNPVGAAEAVRDAWNLGQLPVANLVHLVESRGVRVFSLSEDCDSIDAFSLWRDGTPFMFLNTRKTPERGIFDTAHELGHLLLHRHGTPQGLDAEREADVFAANFVLPESAMRAEAPQTPTVATISAMKRKWHASTAFLGHRLHQLELMSDWGYRQFCIELSKRGRKNEPLPLARETSQLLRKVLTALTQEGMDLRGIARELHLPVSELRALTFGLGVLDGGREASAGERAAALRLVPR